MSGGIMSGHREEKYAQCTHELKCIIRSNYKTKRNLDNNIVLSVVFSATRAVGRFGVL